MTVTRGLGSVFVSLGFGIDSGLGVMGDWMSVPSNLVLYMCHSLIPMDSMMTKSEVCHHLIDRKVSHFMNGHGIGTTSLEHSIDIQGGICFHSQNSGQRH